MHPKRNRQTAPMSTEETEALMNRPMTFFRVEQEEFETWVNHAMAHVEQGGGALVTFETRM